MHQELTNFKVLILRLKKLCFWCQLRMCDYQKTRAVPLDYRLGAHPHDNVREQVCMYFLSKLPQKYDYLGNNIISAI